MEDETGLPFDRYGLLLMLAQANREGLRPSDLADVLPFTPSGVTTSQRSARTPSEPSHTDRNDGQDRDEPLAQALE